MHVTRYRGGTRGRDLTWRVRPSKALAGRTVLVVDDILDHGKTLRALDAELDRVGVAEQLSAVLVVKRLARKRARPTVTVSGLDVDDVYVFGSGMDYRGYWRGIARHLRRRRTVQRDGARVDRRQRIRAARARGIDAEPDQDAVR